MDPSAITTEQWRELFFSAKLLFLVVPFVAAFALCFLLGFAIIPSLVWSRHISTRAQRLAPLLLLLGVGSLIVAVLIAVVALSNAAVVSEFYNRWVI